MPAMTKAAPARAALETRNRGNGSQIHVHNTAEEQIMNNSIIIAQFDETAKYSDDDVKHPMVLDRPAVRKIIEDALPDDPGALEAYDRATRTPEEKAALKQWHRDLVASAPVADPERTLDMLHGTTDPDRAHRIIQSQIPTHPKPTEVKSPAWAAEVGDWSWNGTEWERALSHPLRWAEGGGVTVSTIQQVHPDGSVTTLPTEILIDIEDNMLSDADAASVVGDARELANFLLEAADIVEGERGFRDAGGPIQRLIAGAIRHVLKNRPIGQNQLAVAAGYGPDELSQLMTGRRLMDTSDIQRIAKALDIDPVDLMRMAAEQ